MEVREREVRKLIRKKKFLDLDSGSGEVRIGFHLGWNLNIILDFESCDCRLRVFSYTYDTTASSSGGYPNTDLQICSVAASEIEGKIYAACRSFQCQWCRWLIAAIGWLS